MSQILTAHPEPTDVVSHLYLTAEAIEHLAETLPENMGGLAHILGKLGDDVHLCAVILDDEEPPEWAAKAEE